MTPGVDYIGVGVGALIQDDSGNIFMGLRGPQAKNERGKWEVPGGAVHFGETLEEAIIRECKEEFNIVVTPHHVFDVFTHIMPEEKQHWVATTFSCSIASGTPQILEPEKCVQIGWFSLEEAKRLPLSLVVDQDLRKLAQQQK